LADASHSLRCAREDEVLEQALVVTHATRGVIVHADSERIAVETDVGRSGVARLEGHAHGIAWPTVRVEPLEGGPRVEPLEDGA
jgi:hypothetical protein